MYVSQVSSGWQYFAQQWLRTNDHHGNTVTDWEGVAGK